MNPLSRIVNRLLRVATLLTVIFPGALVLASGAVEPVDPAFVPGLPDIPLMRGLDVAEDETVVFDKPDGRIVEAAVAGRVAVSEFLSYYESALPGLGWTPALRNERRSGELSFQREGEVLRLEFAPRGHSLSVRFFLSPD